MDYTEFFWRAWNRLFMALPHGTQAEVLGHPGGDAWLHLAWASALESEAEFFFAQTA